MRQENGVLLVRADANPQIGTGHVMRCLALAQAWQETGGTAKFALVDRTQGLETRLASERMEICRIQPMPGSPEDAAQTIDLARQAGATWVVVDGYHFGADYQRAIKQADLSLLFVDDYGHANHYYADLVLNQNIYADAPLYASRESYTRLLLGTRYALLRREFWPWRGWQREIAPVARQVLITMGGADPDNVTLKAMRALQQIELEGLEAVVVIGASYPHELTLQSAIGNRQSKIRLAPNATNMPELMAWADVAISAGGSTCWELAFMGVPNLVVILADNQRPVAERLATDSVAVSLGWHQHVTASDIALALEQFLSSVPNRIAMTRRGQILIDGNGTARTLMHLQRERFWLRKARRDDQRLIWEWANEPNTRAVSFSSDTIPWEHHVRWFESKLNDPNCTFLIVVNESDQPIGQIRYDHDAEKREAMVSVSLAPSYRGQGYGGAVIRRASRQFLSNSEIQMIRAYVKPDNEASARVFLAAGFRNIGSLLVKGNPAIQFVLYKDDPA